MTPADYKSIRKQMGLTQATLGGHLGVSRAVIANREGGVTPITPKAALAIKKLLQHHDSTATISRRQEKDAWCAKVDWSQRNAIIAEEFGKSTYAVHEARRRYAPPEHQQLPRGPMAIDTASLEGVDWSRKDEDLAKDLKLTLLATRRARRKHAPPEHCPPAKNKRYVDVDWAKKDTELARERGVSRAAINYARGIYAPETRGRPRSKYADVDWSLSDAEIAEKVGVGRAAAGSARSIYAPGTSGRSQSTLAEKYADVDWSRTNRDIAEELGLVPGTVSKLRVQLAPETAQKRRKGRVRRPKAAPPLRRWNGSPGSTGHGPTRTSQRNLG